MLYAIKLCAMPSYGLHSDYAANGAFGATVLYINDAMHLSQL